MTAAVNQSKGQETWGPHRADGLQRLQRFVPHAGRAYQNTRNHDFGPLNRTNVSALSPYVRHRLILEEEIVAAVLARHSLAAAEKFIQEVCWRTYWKGWLEQRPGVWRDYRDTVERAEAEIASSRRGSDDLRRALDSETGIACFDAWVGELTTHGYLHNHARMWFASIWIHTLRLPWQLGADFFLRHLLDGDAAANTLSWRWVAGLHTPGKIYLARPDNIVRYTDGRFDMPRGLNTHVEPSFPPALPPPVSLRPLRPLPATGRLTLLVTEEDLTPETLALPVDRIEEVLILDAPDALPGIAAPVAAFRRQALDDAATRAKTAFGRDPRRIGLEDLVEVIGQGDCIVTAEVAVGPFRDCIESALGKSLTDLSNVVEIRRRWDAVFWPSARSGFFKLKERIPAVLTNLGYLSSNETPMLPGLFETAPNAPADTRRSSKSERRARQ
jgi:deoxyribodipyrimidine photo-lyase